jgi:hypothetical protein
MWGYMGKRTIPDIHGSHAKFRNGVSGELGRSFAIILWDYADIGALNLFGGGVRLSSGSVCSKTICSWKAWVRRHWYLQLQHFNCVLIFEAKVNACPAKVRPRNRTWDWTNPRDHWHNLPQLLRMRGKMASKGWGCWFRHRKRHATEHWEYSGTISL